MANTFFKDALPVSISGPVGTGRVSLLDLLKQTYGDDAGTIQQVSLFKIDANQLAASNLSYWDPNNKILTDVILPPGVSLDNIPAARFADVQIVIGNNIAPNLFLTVPESFTPATSDFVGHNLAITALPQQLDAPGASDRVPNAADIVSAARLIATVENGVANANDCHNIASAIAASAGATLDSQSAFTKDSEPANEASGFWRIAFTKGAAGADWQSKVQPGDIVRMERTDGGVHTVTVTAGLNAKGEIQVVDNSNKIISEHWQDYDNDTKPGSVTIYRLTTDGVYLNDQSSDGHNNSILGSQFNDLIKAGNGNDTLFGGKGGNDTLDGGNGDDTAVFHGKQSDYKITVVDGKTATLTDLRAGAADGTDTIKNIEHVKFADGTKNFGDLKTTAGPAPVAGSVTISDAKVTEGDNGTQIETFTVTRTGGSAAFDIDFATSNGSATTADGDYAAKTGKVHFDAGVNTQTVSIVVNGDTRAEGDESFNVNLSGATNGATIKDAQGVGTIANNDVAKPVAGSVTISDAKVTEGDNGTQIQTFTVTRTGGSAAFDVDFATSNGSATTADGDYAAKTGKVHFDAGVNTQTVSIVVNGDTKVEGDETFNVSLSGATNGATITDAQGVGTIANNDVVKPVAGSVTISDATITEGDNGTQIQTFTVNRTGGSAAFDVHYATAAGTASGADGDYVAKGGDLHFAAGVNSQTISIVVNGDTRIEANETYKVNLSAATNGAAIADAQGVGTIVNNDVAKPVAGSITISDAKITEGDNGTQIQTFTVTRTGGSAAFDVHYATAAGTASGADGDYVAKGGDLHFAAGVNSQTISIAINGDNKLEVSETFKVNLSAATNGATIADGQGIGTITNDDTAVSHSVANDFNGDGISDALIGKSNGALALWELDGNKIVANSTVGTVPAGWHIDGIADFGGDGKSDILMRNDSGKVAMWQMDGDDVASNTTVGSVGSDWKVIDTDDFNGDGKADILWENNKGQVAMWQMDGDKVASNTTVGSIGTDWKVIGSDDFNGDGNADILWENSKGQVAMWQMDGDKVASNTTVGSIGTNWQAAGTGDFNGDGKADVLWQNDKGQVAMWQMNGDDIASNTSVGSAAGWSVAGTGDYNGDGKADVLFENASGKVAQWQMDGDHIAENLSVGSHSTEWQMV